MLRWWRQRKMRWAVREHRRIHRPDLLLSPCSQRLILKRARTWRMFPGAPIGAGGHLLPPPIGNKIEWRRLTR